MNVSRREDKMAVVIIRGFMRDVIYDLKRVFFMWVNQFEV